MPASGKTQRVVWGPGIRAGRGPRSEHLLWALIPFSAHVFERAREGLNCICLATSIQLANA